MNNNLTICSNHEFVNNKFEQEELLLKIFRETLQRTRGT